ncbi:MAG: D-alanine--D-alanine ligase [Phycisphaerae bacterium]|nr:D-alanine--D-alanine ligase [Phycisphaerae bacterium]
MTRVLVLGGGPDAERDISITSAKGVHQGCLDAGLEAQLLIVDEPTVSEIQQWEADVIFPVLHGKFGEGGSLQGRLERARVAFVGSGFTAASLAMDKLATKLVAAQLDIDTPQACLLDTDKLTKEGVIRSPIDLPIVVKPVQDGSSMGLYICKTESDWRDAQQQIHADLKHHPRRVSMIERYTPGRELTASVISDPHGGGELIALPLIEISPKEGVYDYEAKYTRNDTVYRVRPDLPDRVVAEIQAQALALCNAIGVRHLARVDFLLSADDAWTLLELNTMPGFTPTSLLPQAADAIGLPMPMLCAHLVRCAQANHTHKTHPTPTH